jgi:hypothetical protein
MHGALCPRKHGKLLRVLTQAQIRSKFEACYKQFIFCYSKGGSHTNLGFPCDACLYVSSRWSTFCICYAIDKIAGSLHSDRTGAHHLAIGTGRWEGPVVPQVVRLCSRCTRHANEMSCIYVLLPCLSTDQA